LKLTYRDLTPEKWYAFEQKIVEQQILTGDTPRYMKKNTGKKDGTIFPAELKDISDQGRNGQQHRYVGYRP